MTPKPVTGKHFDDAIPAGRIAVRLCTLDTTNQTVIIALGYIIKTKKFTAL